jgi:PAS domain S-box-containing protein
MLQRSAKLPPNSFMLFILLMRDATGVTHNGDDALRQIHKIANAPVNGIFKNQLGMGIIGGRLYADDLEAIGSAQVAVRILRGEPASSFPPRVVPPSRPRYDWRELQRWSISENRLPPGSTVLFREPTIWERYWKAITGTILFCLLQAALIVSLLINRAKRRRGEEEATLIADISSKFVNLPPGEVDREIVDAQRRIFEVLDLDVSGFWQWSADALGFFRLTHYSRAGEGPQIPERMNSQEYFPWYQQQVLAGRTIAVRSMTELPPEAARDRETFRQFGFKSNLTIPLAVGGEPPIGALGFNTTRVERDWPDALVKRLQLVAEIFASALARQRADQALRESEARFRTIAKTVPVLIWMAGTDKLCNFVNKGWLDFTGRTLEQELGTGWAEGIHQEDTDRCLNVYTNAFDARQEFRMEYRLRKRDGTYGWVLDTGVPRFAHDGTFLGYIGSCVDITERREAENDAREVSGKLITAQEDERKRIARDLHDDLNQRLALLSVEMELFAREAGTDREAWLQHIEVMAGRVREMSTNVHKLSYQLHPAKLDQLGLVVAARTFCREVSLQSGIAVHFEQHDVPRDIAVNVALCLYRVIQEAVQNSVRHNGGAAIQVILAYAAEKIRLLITDEGKGFDADHAIHHGGLGLVSMRERVRQVHGSIQFNSSPGKGARIEVTVPLLHQAPAG